MVGGVGCGVGLGVAFTTTNLGGSESRPGVESAAGPAVNNCDGDWVAVRVIEGSNLSMSGVGRQEGVRTAGNVTVEGYSGLQARKAVLGID